MAIDWNRVSEELKTKFESRLPQGLTLANIKFADARVVSIETVDPNPAEMRAAAEMEKAGGPAMITNGKPTIMRVVAWLAHEGINKNRLAFVADDLRQAAAKIKEPDFIPMDFNHSAVDSFGWAQKAIGVWYKAEVANDPEADNAVGILATGMMWSWMNPDIADRLLAEQARNGRMDFSMACICGSVTNARNDDGPYEIAGDTTFFTLSALDVPPADPAATGLGVEGSEEPTLEQNLRDELKGTAKPATADANPLAIPLSTQLAQMFARASITKETPMEELLAQLKDLSANAAKIADGNLKEALEKSLDAKLAEITAKIDGDNDLRAKLAESETARDMAQSEIEKANAEMARLAAELEKAEAELKAFREAESKKAEEKKLAARIAGLPTAYREAFEKRDESEQNASKARWSKMSDEEWTAFTKDLGVMPVARSYLARSDDEGRLPVAGGADTSVRKRLSQFK